MKKITNIKYSGNKKYILTIDNEKLSVNEDVLINNNTLIKKDISDKEYENIKKNAEYFDVYYKIIKYIKSKLRTKKEIMTKLESYKLTSKEIDDILSKLINDGYLNDELYINSFINDNINHTLNGPIKITNTLLRLEFNKDIINKYLNEIDDEIWLSRIEKIISKKVKVSGSLSSKMLKQKIYNDLINLGYNEETFNNLLDKIDKDDSQNYEKIYEKEYKRLSKKYSGLVLENKIKQRMYTLGFDPNKNC